MEIPLLPKMSLKFAIAAGLAGFAVGFASYRSHPRGHSLATIQGLEWFLSAGGASLLASALRRALDDANQEVTERVVTVEQTVFDRSTD